MDIIVGIGEYAVSNNPGDVLKTFALASCVAVTVYSKTKKAAGMVHIALPSPPVARYKKAKSNCYYATTAIPFLFDEMHRNFGCSKHELEVNIFGGASSVRRDDVFNIGEKNVFAVKRTLTNMDVGWASSQTGGTQIRTLKMAVKTGAIAVEEQFIII